MSKHKSIYEQVLMVAEIAREIEFEYRKEIKDQESRQVKKIVNRPIDSFKPIHEAYQKFLRDY